MLLAFMVLRVLWRFISPPPPTLTSYSPMTRLGAKLGHAFLYLCLFAVMIAGYLISTADGVGIPVFDCLKCLHWFPDYRTRQITPV
jgi:cytochrome b561